MCCWNQGFSSAIGEIDGDLVHLLMLLSWLSRLTFTTESNKFKQSLVDWITACQHFPGNTSLNAFNSRTVIVLIAIIKFDVTDRQVTAI